MHNSGRITHIVRESCLPVFVKQQGCTVCVKECTFTQNEYVMLSGRIRQQTAGLRLIFEKFNRECCDREIERLANLGQECQAQFVVAIGGGKTIDTGKIVADRLGIPVAEIITNDNLRSYFIELTFDELGYTNKLIKYGRLKG